MSKKQPWITNEILSRMNERSKLKQQSNKRDEYKELCREIQRQCRQAKEQYYNKICEELEDLDKKHNPKLYARIKDLQIRKPRAKAGLKNLEGKMLMTTQEIVDRWEEYVRNYTLKIDKVNNNQ